MLERIFCILIIFYSTGGLFLQSGIIQKKPRRNMFIFYTNQSNAIIALYHLLLLVAGFFKESAFYAVLKNPTIQMCMTLMIWVTHIIYHFVLVPTFKKQSRSYEDTRNGLGNLCVHYIVPLLTLAEWLVCADKNITILSCVIWLIIPALYFIYAFIRAKVGGPIGRTNSAYPYPFMDLDLLGTKKFLRNLALVFALFLGLALLMLLAVKMTAHF